MADDFTDFLLGGDAPDLPFRGTEGAGRATNPYAMLSSDAGPSPYGPITQGGGGGDPFQIFLANNQSLMDAYDARTGGAGEVYAPDFAMGQSSGQIRASQNAQNAARAKPNETTPGTGGPQGAGKSRAPVARGDATTEAYQAHSDAMSAKYGVDPRIMRALFMQESGWNPTARSPVGALGIAQFMPETAAGMGLADPLEPYSAIDAAVNHIATLLQYYKGDYRKALAAYNAGQGNVDKYGGVPPFKETQDYVRIIMGNAGMR